MDLHHFVMEESGDVEILLQDLLSSSETMKGKTELNNTIAWLLMSRYKFESFSLNQATYVVYYIFALFLTFRF